MPTKPRAQLDASVIIRFLTSDDLKKQARCAKLFEQLQQKKINLYLADTTIADCIYVLTSPRLYQHSHTEAASLLLPIVKLPSIKCNHKQIILEALNIFSLNNIDFGDAVIIASTKLSKTNHVYSYDQDFDKFPEISRQEP